ncbi:hypothetical protein [Pseudodesulfovibrio sp. zrk46]|uniref:hypothetical protein n=1 Tax=Pseudodesulfovibrio sp. zrk46 TaxID=2725288 RepID=UPI001B36A325|nr:hypothetical protein [Pseudodesulfovibrio sp. zrk46]
MNISPHNSDVQLERFSFPLVAVLFLIPLLVAVAIGYFFGIAWGVAILTILIWSDFLLRAANVNFRGRRKKDKVMAPLVTKSFTGHVRDPHLGWTLAPNKTNENSFAIPRKKLSLKYTVTTDAQGRRVTTESPVDSDTTINFYGCSNTFGWGLDDNTTYTWLVQAARPDSAIHNYGVSGYSLYQILLKMEQTIERDRPKLVILGFSPGLEARSVSDHHYLRILAEQGGTAPSCISKDKGGKRALKRYPVEGYKHLPLSDKSPLIKLVERRLNRLFYGGRAKNEAHRKTTEHLLLSMEHLCKKHGATFHVQYLVANTGYREFLHKTGLNWAPGPVDLDLCDEVGTYLYRLSPFDGHPNVAANAAYAEELGPVIDQLLETGKYRPEPGALGTTKRDKATEQEIYPVF